MPLSEVCVRFDSNHVSTMDPFLSALQSCLFFPPYLLQLKTYLDALWKNRLAVNRRRTCYRTSARRHAHNPLTQQIFNFGAYDSSGTPANRFILAYNVHELGDATTRPVLGRPSPYFLIFPLPPRHRSSRLDGLLVATSYAGLFGEIGV